MSPGKHASRIARPQTKHIRLELRDPLELATKCFIRGQYAQAVVAIEHYRATSCRHPAGTAVYCRIMISLDRFADAEKALAQLQSTRHRELRRNYLRLRSEISCRRGDADDERECIRQLIEESPEDADGFIRMGQHLMRGGDLAGAEEYFRVGTDCSNGSGDAHYHLGRVMLCHCRLDEAKQSFARAVALIPDYELAVSALEDVSDAILLAHHGIGRDGRA